MDDVRVQFEGVWKKFRRGDFSNSLRDALPALLRRWRGQPGDSATLRRSEFYSLEDINFQVKSGECLGVIGHNGAGKSTLLKCASRILRPNRGNISVRGRVSALIEVGAGFHPDLTGRENIFLNGTILGMRRREIADRFDQIVDFSGMHQFIDTPVKRYSSGMYARLGFSVAAFMDPDVLLIDEVLSVGDMSFARKCEKKTKEIASSNTTVLFVSHNLAAVRMICERVILLSGGRIQFDGNPQEAIQRYHEQIDQCENVKHSNQAAHIAQFALGDALGNSLLSVTPGDTLMLEIEMIARERVRDVAVGFCVCDLQGNELYTCSHGTLGGETFDLEVGQKVRTRFRFAAHLLPGTYWLGSIVYGRTDACTMGNIITLESTPHRYQCVVNGEAEARGTTNLFAACETQVETVHQPVPVHEGVTH